jgi:hypothetical protein
MKKLSRWSLFVAFAFIQSVVAQNLPAEDRETAEKLIHAVTAMCGSVRHRHQKRQKPYNFSGFSTRMR